MKNFNPIVYFNSIWTPTSMFKGRKALNWGSMSFIFIFLMSCLMFPITIKTSQLPTVSLEMFVPNSLDSITEEVVQALSNSQANENSFEGPTFQTSQVAGWLSDKDMFLSSIDKGIYFDTIGFYLKLNAVDIVKIPYKFPIDTTTFNDIEQVKSFLSTQWFNANRSYIIISILMSMIAIIGTNTLLILLGSAFFLWLTRRSKLFTMTTYKECLNLVLNTMGISTLIATVCLFFGLDVPIVLQLHGLLTVVAIVLVFYFTHYNDHYILNRKKSFK